MTPADIEINNAMLLLDCARRLATYHSQPGDREAVTAAILARAYELATHDLSPRNRASVFYNEDWNQ